MLVSGMRILANVYTVDGTGLLTRGVPRRGSRRSSGPGSLAPGGVRRQGRGKNADERQCEQHGLLACCGGDEGACAREGRVRGGWEGRVRVVRGGEVYIVLTPPHILFRLKRVSPRLIFDLSHPLRYTFRATPLFPS